MVFSKLKNGILILLGVIILSYILYIRLFKENIPHDFSTNLYLNNNYIPISFYVILCIIFAYLITQNLKILLNKNLNLNKPIQVVSKFFTDCLKAVHYWVFSKTILNKYSYRIGKSIGIFCYTYYFSREKIIGLLLFFIIIPKIIVLTFLIIDVFWFFKLNYVYKVSFLLLIPIMERYIIYIIEQFCEVNCLYFDETLKITKKNDENNIIMSSNQYFSNLFHDVVASDNIYFELSEKFKIQYKNVTYNAEKTLKNTVNILNFEVLPSKFFHLLYFTIKTKSRLLPYFNIFLYSGYFLIWLYVLGYSF